jgi:uncharacterized protein (TIGR02594 family)
MTPYERALAEIGTREVVGVRHNATIVRYFSDAGHAWVKDDETAWCAAFVGAMLARSGVKPSGLLTARSYLAWGEPVELAAAKPGDIAVFRRGTSEWQGHVAFFEGLAGDRVRVLGGNQSNSVSRASYPLADLLAIRRTASQGRPPVSSKPPPASRTTPKPPSALWGALAAAAAIAFAYIMGRK